jgi:hypothetical protein
MRMGRHGEEILASFRAVAAERRARERDPRFLAWLQAVKVFQHARFRRTYVDLLAHPRYAKAAAFFLEELYGPSDFSARDEQFVRIVPALVRMLPTEVLETVAKLSGLHALSESLDSAMARALIGEAALDPARYVAAWQAVGCVAERSRQIDLIVELGRAIERYTRNALLRHTLRLMRGPSRAAGFGALQTFLETGFETFREMRGASEFLATIEERERRLAKALFEADLAALPAALLSELAY